MSSLRSSSVKEGTTSKRARKPATLHQSLLGPTQRVRAAAKRLNDAQNALKVARSNLRIPCMACGAKPKLCEMAIISVKHYIEPYSCSGGDYWTHGENQFVCPKCEVGNRLLFFGDDYYLKNEKPLEHDAAHVFRLTYTECFKVRFEEKDKEQKRRWVNNQYLDSAEGRAAFGLPARTSRHG